MLKRFLKLIIGVALLPLCWGVSVGLFRQLTAVRAIRSMGWFFVAGVLSYSLLYACSVRLRILYVFGHEAVHAICAWLCGGKVKSFQFERSACPHKVNPHKPGGLRHPP